MKKALDELPALAHVFGRARAGVAIDSSNTTIVVRNNDRQFLREYTLPELLEENKYRIPGWFKAGIWEDMKLPDMRERPDAILLEAWSFKREDKNFLKILTDAKCLIYTPSTNLLVIRNTISNSLTELGPFPTNSLFHAEKLFEENGFFPELHEKPIVSRSLQDF